MRRGGITFPYNFTDNQSVLHALFGIRHCTVRADFQTICTRRNIMKVIKTLIVLAVAAGFSSVSFAAETTAPAAEVTKTVAAKPMVKKHHHKAKMVKNTAAKNKAVPAATPAAT